MSTGPERGREPGGGRRAARGGAAAGRVLKLAGLSFVAGAAVGAGWMGGLVLGWWGLPESWVETAATLAARRAGVEVVALEVTRVAADAVEVREAVVVAGGWRVELRGMEGEVEGVAALAPRVRRLRVAKIVATPPEGWPGRGGDEGTEGGEDSGEPMRTVVARVLAALVVPEGEVSSWELGLGSGAGVVRGAVTWVAAERSRRATVVLSAAWEGLAVDANLRADVPGGAVEVDVRARLPGREEFAAWKERLAGIGVRVSLPEPVEAVIVEGVVADVEARVPLALPSAPIWRAGAGVAGARVVLEAGEVMFGPVEAELVGAGRSLGRYEATVPRVEFRAAEAATAGERLEARASAVRVEGEGGQVVARVPSAVVEISPGRRGRGAGTLTWSAEGGGAFAGWVSAVFDAWALEPAEVTATVVTGGVVAAGGPGVVAEGPVRVEVGAWSVDRGADGRVSGRAPWRVGAVDVAGGRLSEVRGAVDGSVGGGEDRVLAVEVTVPRQPVRWAAGGGRDWARAAGDERAEAGARAAGGTVARGDVSATLTIGGPLETPSVGLAAEVAELRVAAASGVAGAGAMAVEVRQPAVPLRRFRENLVGAAWETLAGLTVTGSAESLAAEAGGVVVDRGRATWAVSGADLGPVSGVDVTVEGLRAMVPAAQAGVNRTSVVFAGGWAGGVADVDASVRGTDLRFTGRQTVSWVTGLRARGVLVCDDAPVTGVAPWDAVVPALAGLEVTGRLSASVNYAFREGALEASASVDARGFRVAPESGGAWRVEGVGVAGAVSVGPGGVVSLAAPVEATVGLAAAGALEFRDGIVRLEPAGGGAGGPAVRLARASALGFGGTVSVRPVTVSLASADAGPVATAVLLEEVDIAQVLAAFPELKAGGSGKVSGELPLVWEKGRLHPGTTRLVASDGPNVVLRLPPARLGTGTAGGLDLQGRALDRVDRAMAELGVGEVRLEFSPEDEPGVALRLRTAGSYSDAEGRVGVDLTLRVRGDLEGLLQLGR